MKVVIALPDILWAPSFPESICMPPFLHTCYEANDLRTWTLKFCNFKFTKKKTRELFLFNLEHKEILTSFSKSLVQEYQIELRIQRRSYEQGNRHIWFWLPLELPTWITISLKHIQVTSIGQDFKQNSKFYLHQNVTVEWHWYCQMWQVLINYLVSHI